jgi:hypothetical protein
MISLSTVTWRLVPAFASFRDVSDVNSGRLVSFPDGRPEEPERDRWNPWVSQDRASKPLGPGVRISHVWLEALHPSPWSFGILYPRDAWMADWIEQQLPFVVSQRAALRSIIDDMPPRFRPHYRYFKTD